MPSIEDYALIGDCETAALVSRDGSSTGSAFRDLTHLRASPRCSELLSMVDGCWHHAARSTPSGGNTSADTAVLETEFTTSDGVVAVIDFMPVRSGLPDLVRTVIGRPGKVEMRMELTIRFDYGSVVPWVRRVPMNERLTSKPPKLHGRDGATTHAYRAGADALGFKAW